MMKHAQAIDEVKALGSKRGVEKVGLDHVGRAEMPGVVVSGIHGSAEVEADHLPGDPP